MPGSPSAGVLLDLAREAQDRQLGAINSLDNKSTGTIGLAGVVLSLLFTSDTARSHWSAGLTAGVAALGAGTVLLLVALAPRRYRRNPNLVAFVPGYLTADPDETQKVATESIVRAIVFNQDILRWKANSMRLGMAFVGLGIGLTAAGLIYSVV